MKPVDMAGINYSITTLQNEWLTQKWWQESTAQHLNDSEKQTYFKKLGLLAIKYPIFPASVT